MRKENNGKIQYGKEMFMEEGYKESKMQFRVTNPFPTNSVAKNIFLELINKNKGFSTPVVTRDDIFIKYEGRNWVPEVKEELKDIITFDLFETRKLICEIAEHELVRGF
jgi:hypothetical protein